MGLKHLAWGVLLSASPLWAQDTAEIVTCGDLGYDNRPNMCVRPSDDGPTQGVSSCTKLDDTTYVYTHCSGATTTYTGSDKCCLESNECPGATYVASCVN